MTFIKTNQNNIVSAQALDFTRTFNWPGCFFKKVEKKPIGVLNRMQSFLNIQPDKKKSSEELRSWHTSFVVVILV